MKKPLLHSLIALLPLAVSAQGFHEGFSDIAALEGNGWAMTNQSNPVGATGWMQGPTGTFSAYSGPASSFIAANYLNTGTADGASGSGDISNWLITPAVNVVDGDILSFWTRTTPETQWNDRLEVRSGTGTMTLPSGAGDVGSFTTLLLAINDGYDLSYPLAWTRYSVTVSGVGGTPTPVRFAFRYNVVDGGPDGTDSNFIGIDALFIGNPADENEGAEPVELCTPVLDCTDGDLITNVTFQEINNTTACGADGYSDLTGMQAHVAAGQSYGISVTVGDGWEFESVSVWVDWNANDMFEEGEFTFIATGTDEALSGTIAVPAGTPDGNYRMRVRVAAVGDEDATADMACDDTQGYGETEDYTVVVGLGTGMGENAAHAFSFFPNPMHDALHIATDGRLIALEAYNMVGQQVLSLGKLNGKPVDVSGLTTGVYVFRATLEGGQTKTFKVTKD